MKNTSTNVPKSFWILAVVLLVWNIMGVLSFLMHVMLTEEAISEFSKAEQAIYRQYPTWTIIAFAIAVFAGLMGAIGLLMRRKWSFIVFVISLLAIIPQMIHNVFFTQSVEVYGTAEAVSMPALVAVLGFFAVWYAKYSSMNGWLK